MLISTQIITHCATSRTATGAQARVIVAMVSSISGINEDARERSATIQTATNAIIKVSLAPTPSKVGAVATVIRPQLGKV